MNRILLLVAMCTVSSNCFSHSVASLFATQASSYADSLLELNSDGVAPVAGGPTAQLMRYMPYVSSNMSVSNMQTAVSRLIDTINADRERRFDDIHTAMLVKLSVPIAAYIESVVMRVLTNLDACTSYWQQQKEQLLLNQVRNLSSLQLTSMAQFEQQLDHKLDLLRGVQNKHFCLLSELHAMCARFDRQASVHVQVGWIAQIVSLARVMCSRAFDETIRAADYDTCALLAPEMLQMLTDLAEHDKNVRVEIASAQIPSSWQRYRLHYLGAAAAGTTVGMALYKNRHKIDDWASHGAQATMTTFKQPVRALKSFFIGEDDQWRAQAVERYRDTLIKKRRVLNIPDSITDAQINEAAKNLDRHFLSDVMRRFGSKRLRSIHFYDWPVSGWWHAGYLKNEMPGLIDLWLKSAESELKDTNKLLITLGGIIPTVIAIAGVSKLAHWAYQSTRRKTTAKPMRDALADIARILNKYNRVQKPMPSEENGRLIYLGYKLKTCQYAMTDSDRRRFRADVEYITLRNVHPDKKLRTIDLMYRTYDFLSASR